jgi:beta-N-acetylhexosaminidase
LSDPASSVLVCAVQGTSLSTEELNFFNTVQPAGVTLFRRNIPEDYSQTSRLNEALQKTVSGGAPKMIVAIDQEGGRVARLKEPFPDHGAAMLLAGGLSDGAALIDVKDAAEQVGLALLELGVNVNFAPCVDILTEPANISIGDRAFGTDVDPVCKRAKAWLEGLQATGVLGCLKHFPGQGDAVVDTHVGKAIVDLPRNILDQRELIPYRAMLSSVEMVMISHCIYPQIANIEASRSPEMIGGVLRGEMGYEGVVVSDDLNMGAIPQDRKSWEEALIEVLMAGGDMLLVCEHLERFQWAYEAITAAMKKSKTVENRVIDAAKRVTAMRAKL